MESVVLLCMFFGNPRGGRITFFLDRDHGRGERCRWRTASGRDGCLERDFLGMCHGYGWEVSTGIPGTTGDGITFSVCRNEESRSYGYRNPVYPGDDGEGYEGVGRRDRDGVLHAGEKCFYRGDYSDQGRGFIAGVPDEPVTSVGNLNAGIEDCRE